MRRKLSVMGVVAALIMSVAGSTAPAQAANGDWARVVHMGIPNVCLTATDPPGNAAGRVYFTACEPDNDLQRWYLWYHSWTINKASGQCLTLRPLWVVNTMDCVRGNVYQDWQQWHTGWVRNPFDAACLRNSALLEAHGAECIEAPGHGQHFSHDRW